MPERNIFNVYQKILKKEGNHCDRKCSAILTYGSAHCIGRVSQEDNRPVLSTDDRTFVINSVKHPSEVIKFLPSDCPYFKNK